MKTTTKTILTLTLGLSVLATVTYSALETRSKASALTLATESALDPAQSQDILQALAQSDRSRTISQPLVSSDAPWANEANSREFLNQLTQGIYDRDSEAASALVEKWFQGGSASVDQLLALTQSAESNFEEAAALGLLLKSATYFIVNEPEKLDPWTIDSLTLSAMDLIGQADHVPIVLLTGLDEVGSYLSPQYMLDLIDIYETRPIGPPIESQVPCLKLAKAWAVSMGPELEGMLLSEIRREGFTDGNRAHASSMLLERDWSRMAPELLALKQQLGDSGVLEQEGSSCLVNILARQITDLQPFEKVEYYGMLSRDPELAFNMAWVLNAEDAKLALSQPTSQDLQGSALDLLRLRAGDGDTYELGLRILSDRSGVGRVDGIDSLVIGSWLQSDLAVDERFSSFMEPRFKSRDSDPGAFWSSLANHFGKLEDYQIIGGILPWLTRSKGENNVHRSRLLSMVASRFEGMNIE